VLHVLCLPTEVVFFSSEVSAGGMPGMNGRGGGARQDPPIEHALPCTLEDLYKGTTKRLKISRNVTDASGRTERVTETLSVDVKPGWKKGTKVTFPKKGECIARPWDELFGLLRSLACQHALGVLCSAGMLQHALHYMLQSSCFPVLSTQTRLGRSDRMHSQSLWSMTVSVDKQLLIQCLTVSLHVGERNSHAAAGDERPGSMPADIVFVIEEKQHPQFSREGNDLAYSARLPLVDALCGATVRLQTLDGRPLTVGCLSLLADAALHTSCTDR
jgi:DnaJ-class molecular chaperone